MDNETIEVNYNLVKSNNKAKIFEEIFKFMNILPKWFIKMFNFLSWLNNQTFIEPHYSQATQKLNNFRRRLNRKLSISISKKYNAFLFSINIANLKIRYKGKVVYEETRS